MLQVQKIRTFAINAKELTQAEKFYTQVLGGTVVRKIDPTEDQLKRGRVKAVDVQLGNFQVHIFDASKDARRRRLGRAGPGGGPLSSRRAYFR